jgi:hypothetical protein
LNVLTWFGMLAPAKTPPPIIMRRLDATVAVLKQTEAV